MYRIELREVLCLVSVTEQCVFYMNLPGVVSLLNLVGPIVLLVSVKLLSCYKNDEQFAKNTPVSSTLQTGMRISSVLVILCVLDDVIRTGAVSLQAFARQTTKACQTQLHLSQRLIDVNLRAYAICLPH